jgi:hypothetical protein
VTPRTALVARDRIGVSPAVAVPAPVAPAIAAPAPAVAPPVRATPAPTIDAAEREFGFER